MQNSPLQCVRERDEEMVVGHLATAPVGEQSGPARGGGLHAEPPVEAGGDEAEDRWHARGLGWGGGGGGLEARMQAPLTARPKEPRRAIAPAAWDPTAAVVWPRRVGPYPGMETVNWTVDHFSHTDPPNLCRSILPPSAIASP